MSLHACPTCARHHDPATACPFCAAGTGEVEPLSARLGGALLLSAATTLGCVAGAPAGLAPTPSPTASSSVAGSVPTPTPQPTPANPSTTYGMPPPPRKRG